MSFVLQPSKRNNFTGGNGGASLRNSVWSKPFQMVSMSFLTVVDITIFIFWYCSKILIFYLARISYFASNDLS
jgi:hypothetical protein